MMRAAAVVLAIAGAAGCAGKQNTGVSNARCGPKEQTGIVGIAIEAATKEPVLGVTVIVTVSGQDTTSATNSDGLYFLHLPPGTHDLTAIYGDITTVVRGIVVGDDDPVSVCIVLDIETGQRGPVNVTVPWSAKSCQ